MKIRIFLTLFSFLLASTSAGLAQPLADVTAQLKTLVEKTNAKIQQGQTTEAGLAEELKGFDALLAAHSSQKTDAVAQVLLMKAALYLQIIQDMDRATALFEQLTKEFPGTRPASEAAQMLVGMESQREQMKIQAALKIGATFPDFEVKDLTGAPLSVARFKGKAVLIDFWATWCGPCITELPAVLAAYSRYKDKGFEIIGISLDRDEATLKRFIADRKMTWPNYFDGQEWKSPLAAKYGVNAIPATYLLDGEGRIVAKNLRGPALEQELARLLGP
jgi:peroxiredoxin